MKKTILTLLFLFWSNWCYANPYYVRTDGSDSNNGLTDSAGGAWLTIQKAADTLTAGQTVYIRAGTYNERNIVIANNGSSGNPIVFQGDVDGSDIPTTIVHGGDTVTGWALETDPWASGKGVYSTTTIGYDPITLTIQISGEDYVVPIIRDTDWQTWLAYASTATRVAPDIPSVTINVWDGIQVMAYATASECWIAFKGDDNPASYTIKACPDGYGFAIWGEDYITLKNMKLICQDMGIQSIIQAGDRTGNLTIDNLHIMTGTRKINTTDNDNITIKNCKLHLQTYGKYIDGYTFGAWDEGTTYTQGVRNHLYDFYKYDVNLGGGADSDICIFSTGTGAEIYDNEFFDGFDSMRANANNANIYSNTIYNFSSAGIYLHCPTPATGMSIYSNTFYNCNTAFRFGDTDTGGMGINIYKNTSWNDTTAGRFIHFHFGAGSGSQSSWINVDFYHNSIDSRAFSYVSEWIDNWGGDGLKNVRYIDNIMSVAEYENNTSLQNRPNLYEQFEYNWVTGVNSDDAYITGTNLSNHPTRIWDESANHAFAITGSNAVDAGIDVSTTWYIDSNPYDALPGITAGYYVDGNPDMGAIQGTTTTVSIGKFTGAGSFR
jgi:hypothetical protein